MTQDMKTTLTSIYEAVKGCDQVAHCGEIAIIRTLTSI